MRRIDPHLIAPDKAWDKAAKKATIAVGAGANVSEYAEVWSRAKRRLKAVSNRKCWYCEARQDRSDNAVDHFRPKSQYPWLAFALSNLRFSCTFCNSVRRDFETDKAGGKGDHFPIFNPPPAATEADIAKEEIVLVDPCRGADVGLIDFKDDGSPCARYTRRSRRKERASRSIGYYHLDHSELIESRRLLALQLKEWIEAADSLFELVDQGDPRVLAAFSGFTENLLEALTEKAEFSAFARRIVDGHRNLPWVEDLLRCV